jgi:hypothetical protein
MYPYGTKAHGGRKTWQRPKSENQSPKVVHGVTFTNGVEVTDTPAQSAARLGRHQFPG